MGIEVGGKLDKYELLEKVGQGGMAVVYRGRDTSLKREVAVKVLHRHLADHQEARDRFEREAQAVAKLRHENILEIYDFSSNGSDESYIVTEFIDGQTLKEFVAEHALRFPEVGAMIAVQVCRALGHAHSVGVLHRDVKPENIMIRTDGVVKLTDFGIAQMIDLRRLTVTGQLLGSPAYMSPEHVEGRPLDFRTDVFAVGIVLYQLTTGELPFQGKNPHEILKRIAECRFSDPRVLNPRIGNELAAIIKRALAHDKEDRFADVSQMVMALDAYLDGSGLADAAGELSRFFAAPVSYEMALKPRLVATLVARGRERMASDKNGGLELFNRALTIDGENREVLEEIDRLGRQQRSLKLVGLVAAIGILVGGAAVVRHSLAGGAAAAADGGPLAARAIDGGPRVLPRDAGAPARRDAGGLAVRSDAGARDHGRPALHPVPLHVDAGAGTELAPAARHVTLVVSPRNSEYSVAGGPWHAIGGDRAELELGQGQIAIAIRNPACCQDEERVVAPDAAGGTTLQVDLRFLPASVIPACGRKGARVRIDDKPWQLGQPASIPIQSLTGKRRVTVTFFVDGTDYIEDQPIDVKPNQRAEVTCAAP